MDNSPFWIASFRDKNGKKMNRSTKIKASERTRKEAQRKADSFEESFTKERESDQTRRVIEEGHAAITGEVLTQTTLKSFIEAWLAEKVGEKLTDNTLRFYRSMCSTILEFYGEKAENDIRKISRDDVVAFRQNQLDLSLTGKTVNHQLKVLRMIFLAALNQDKISKNPCPGVKTIKAEKPIRRPMTKEEIQTVLTYCNAEWRSMVLMALYTGQRISDVSLLTWGNFNFVTQKLRLTQKKTGKLVELVIAGPLKKHLETLTKDDKKTPLHPSAYRAMQRTGRSNGLSTQFSEIMAKAGLRKKQRHVKTHGKGRGIGSGQNEISFHSLRYSAVQFMIEAGISLSVVKDMVGHDAVMMTLHYLQASKEAKIQAAESFPDIEAGMEKPQVKAGE